MLFIIPPFQQPLFIEEKMYIMPPVTSITVSPMTKDKFPVISICTRIAAAHVRKVCIIISYARQSRQCKRKNTGVSF